MADAQLVQSVLKHLEDTDVACTSLTPLCIGIANLTWRGVLANPTPNGAETVIVKHAMTLSLSEDLQLLPARQDHEALVMRAMYSNARATIEKDAVALTISIPKVLHQDPAAHIMVVEDAGQESSNLKQLFQNSVPPEVAATIGEALGVFAGRIHNLQADVDLEQALISEDNQACRVSIFACYDRLVETIGLAPHVNLEPYRQIFQRVETQMKEEMLRGEGARVLHGDYWTGNVLASAAPGEDNVRTHQLYVIDWEIAKIAPPFFDIAQMAAELFLLHFFKGSATALSALDSFLAAYPLENWPRHMIFRTAVHFGVHLTVWPIRIADWGADSIRESCALLGAEYVKRGMDEDIEWLKSSALKALFNSS
ncbi:hypothetical protein HDU85_007187 [Gaertneriomyces sp. JEL0708]|nr:hypothetical protein HDU85_007187 [Gaertneriomyces sp. JEL0708]